MCCLQACFCALFCLKNLRAGAVKRLSTYCYYYERQINAVSLHHYSYVLLTAVGSHNVGCMRKW